MTSFGNEILKAINNEKHVIINENKNEIIDKPLEQTQNNKQDKQDKSIETNNNQDLIIKDNIIKNTDIKDNIIKNTTEENNIYKYIPSNHTIIFCISICIIIYIIFNYINGMQRVLMENIDELNNKRKKYGLINENTI